MSESREPEHCVAFDVGGTSIRGGCYDPATQSITASAHRHTPNLHAHAGASADELQAKLFVELEEMARELAGGKLPQLVGLAFPGPIDPAGNVLSVPTIFGRQVGPPRPIGRQLSKRWPETQVVLMNDVTAAGYYHLNAPDESFCITTVSSGIGNKVFIHGRPMVGPGGRGGEIGHIVVDPAPDALPCDCGGRGHLGGIASGRGTLAALKRAVAEDPAGFENSNLAVNASGAEQITNEAIVAAFHANDAWVTRHVAGVTAYLARVLASIHTAIGIERFVMIGGFALALGEGYRSLLAQLCDDSCWNLGQDWDKMIELGTTGSHAALIGAGRAAYDNWKQPS
ncbi:MAG: ROK family protein [Planctomycetota bacterium]|nr:MAG: ROK family protein [Planctomycetota bacterium]